MRQFSADHKFLEVADTTPKPFGVQMRVPNFGVHMLPFGAYAPDGSSSSFLQFIDSALSERSPYGGIEDVAVARWPITSGPVKLLPTRINFIFETAKDYVDAIVNSGQYLETYLAANLEARINPQGSTIMEHDLERLEVHHSNALKNIRAFRSSPVFAEVVKTNTQVQTEVLPQIVGRVTMPLASEEEASALVYWKSVRESIRNTFTLNLELLAAAVGISYATFANLGKTRPKGPTAAKILRLHELVRALRDNDPLAAPDWLHGEGSRLLRDGGLEAFANAVEHRVFSKTRMVRPSIHLEDDRDDFAGEFPFAERPPRSGKRI